MINPSEPDHKTDAVQQLAEVVADLIQHQKQTALVVQTLIDKVDKLEKSQANG